jgi:hypothetical protein
VLVRIYVVHQKIQLQSHNHNRNHNHENDINSNSITRHLSKTTHNLHTPTTMAAFEVCTFHDSNNNTIKYLFNPFKRLNNRDEGPALLDQIIETFDPEFDTAPSSHIPEPKAGTEMVSYRSRDGADVRYQFDPTAQNGKQYVVAIHREPDNWQRLTEEDLAVDNEEELRKAFQGSEMTNGLKKTTSLERKDSAMDIDTEE